MSKMSKQILLILLITVVAVSGCVSQADTSPLGSTTPDPEVITGNEPTETRIAEREGDSCDPLTETALSVCEGNVGVTYGCIADFTECHQLEQEYLDSFGPCKDSEIECKQECDATGCLEGYAHCSDAYDTCRATSRIKADKCKPTGVWSVTGAFKYCDNIGKGCTVEIDEYTGEENSICK